MRSNKILQLNDKEIVIKEMRVKDIMGMLSNPEQDFTSLLSFMRKGNEIVEQCISGITFGELQDLAPSELKSIYDAFREVNEVFFFDLMGSLGVMDILGNLKSQFTSDLLKASALASSRATAKLSGTMDTASTSLPSP